MFNPEAERSFIARLDKAEISDPERLRFIVDGIMKVQNSVYPEGLQENVSTFMDKVKQYPEGCFLLLDHNKINITGYAISHPGDFSALNEHSIKIDDEKSYYLHDVAVLEEFRNGNGRKMFEMIESTAREKGFEEIYLVAVMGAEVMWERYGFKSVEKIDNYGTDGEVGVKMVKKLSLNDSNEKVL